MLWLFPECFLYFTELSNDQHNLSFDIENLFVITNYNTGFKTKVYTLLLLLLCVCILFVKMHIFDMFIMLLSYNCYFGVTKKLDSYKKDRKEYIRQMK